MTTVVACPPVVLQFFDNRGNPCVGGSVLTQVGGVNYPTYQDPAGLTALPNPIPLNARGEISNAAGASSQLFLVANTVYTFTLSDANGNVLNTASYVNGVQLTGEQIAALLEPITDNPVLNSLARTAAEIAASVTPVNFSYAPGNVLRYGVNSVPGTTDMTAALAAAVAQAAESNGSPVYVPTGTYLIVGPTITIQSNVRIYGDGPDSILNFSTSTNADCFTGSGVSGVTVERLTINCSTQASGNFVGLVAFHNNSTNCRVQDCVLTGAVSSGILLDSSSQNYLLRNYLHSFTYGTGLNDSSDIHVMTTYSTGYNSDGNIIEDNQCYGGNNIGISLETSATPNMLMRKTRISGNRVGTHTAYGIIAYSHQAGDVYVDIDGNYIENISGSSAAQGGATGAGIYVAGCSAVNVRGNTIYNCCTATSASGLTPGGIGINPGTGSPINVTGNQIFDMAQGNGNTGLNISGIYVGGSSGNTTAGINIAGNTISQQVAGGLSNGIYVNVPATFTGINISGNIVNILNTNAGTNGIILYASSATIQGVAITGNTVVGCSVAHIRTAEANSNIVEDITISGNTLFGGAAACTPLLITSANNATITGNRASGGTGNAFYLSLATNVRVSANVFSVTSGYVVVTNGACTGSLIDESNSGLTISNVNNSGTGCQINYYASASPSTGSNVSQVGDTAVNSAPGATTQDRWRCTTAGTPGTWTALALP